MHDNDAELLGRYMDARSDLTVLTCGVCHIRFAMPIDLYHTCMEKDRRGMGAREFYCPNGHQLRFHNREIDTLRQERDRLKQQLARVEDEKADAERALTRTMHRAVSGVCPCCQRSFQQLARHMALQHPEMAAQHRNPPPSRQRPMPMVRKVKGRWTMVPVQPAQSR